MAAGRFPFCCATCLLAVYRFEDGFIRELINYAASVEAITDIPREDFAFMSFPQRETRHRFLIAIINNLIEKFLPGSPPLVHARYYQPEVLVTEFDELDENLGGGLQKGRIYCFLEPYKGYYQSMEMFAGFLSLSQSTVPKSYQVPGIDAEFEKAALISTGTEVHQFTPFFRSTVRFAFQEATDTIDANRLKDLNQAFKQHRNFGLIIVDTLKAFSNWRGRAVNNPNPNIGDWLTVLTKTFGTIEDKIVILLLDESVFQPPYPPPNRQRAALSGVPSMNNLLLIEMCSRYRDWWRVSRHQLPYLEDDGNQDREANGAGQANQDNQNDGNNRGAQGGLDGENQLIDVEGDEDEEADETDENEDEIVDVEG